MRGGHFSRPSWTYLTAPLLSSFSCLGGHGAGAGVAGCDLDAGGRGGAGRGVPPRVVGGAAGRGRVRQHLPQHLPGRGHRGHRPGVRPRHHQRRGLNLNCNGGVRRAAAAQLDL